jgi:hypothetical protein
VTGGQNPAQEGLRDDSFWDKRVEHSPTEICGIE